MNITDELRKWASIEVPYKYCHQLTAIADRIDEEHEKSIVDALLNDGLPMTDENMAEYGWIRLPLDTNGMPIHIGDFVEGTNFREVGQAKGEVVRIVYNKHLNEVRIDTGTSYVDRNPAKVRHVSRPLTVEDVLYAFAQEMNENMGMYTSEAIDSGEWRAADYKTIAEYAKRLRIAGDDE